MLWHIVHDQCTPDQQQSGRPAPCIEVSLAQGGVDRGYAVLRDKHGAEQYLVMPTIEITGIEDVRLLSPGAPNYFADARGDDGGLLDGVAWEWPHTRC